MSKLPLRQELRPQEMWDLSLLYSNQHEFEEAIENYTIDVNQFEGYQGKLNNKDELIQALNSFELINQKASRLGSYANLAYETDKLSRQNEENEMRIRQLYDISGKKLAFFQVELSLLEEAYLEEVANSSEAAKYKSFLAEVIRKKEHYLSIEAEELLSSIDSQLFSQYRLYETMKHQDFEFDDFEAAGQTYHNSFPAFEGNYEAHPEKAVRHQAWESFHKGLASFQHTAAANYISQVQAEKQIAQLRGFSSTIEYHLFDQKVSVEAFNRQIDTLMEHFAPVMQRYAKLLQKQNGLDKITLADIKMPFNSELQTQVSIVESRKMIEDAFANLGEEYSGIIQQAFEERWIDYPMNQTKSTGGFCATVYNGPSYILLNWTGFLNEVLVLAHELGHACHYQLFYRNQASLTPDASLYFVEAPSTANEVIMCQYLLQQDLKFEEKQNLIAEFIARTYFHNMVTHLLEADFQRKVYQAVDQNQLLNSEILNHFFYESLSHFWGDAVEINSGAELTWMRQPHYFMGLYPYTYSAGLTIGTQVGQAIAEGNQTIINEWLQVLKAGGTQDPLVLAKRAGVDMTDDKALKEAIAYVDYLLNQLEQ